MPDLISVGNLHHHFTVKHIIPAAFSDIAGIGMREPPSVKVVGGDFHVMEKSRIEKFT